MDKSSFAGLVIALGGILLGLLLEGGKLTQVLQPTAAIIVFGGTIGAVMLQFPLRVVLAAVRRLGQVFIDNSTDPLTLIAEIVRYAHKARKEGIIALDNDLEAVRDPFLKKTLMLAIDGTEPQEIRKMMELELDNQAEHDDNLPRVFEAAGGFSPTIGIIGAVLGLIQVMQHLDDIGEVGRGIAVAFVATIYGVGAANLFFLPASGKIKIRIRQEQTIREMILEGVISILEGMNPRMIETKLMAFFVVLYASSQVDKRKIGRLALSIQVAFQDLGVFETSNTKVPLADTEAIPFSQVQVVENTDRTTDLQHFVQPMHGMLTPNLAGTPNRDMQAELEKALAPEILKHIVEIKVSREGIVVSLREIGFYESGSANIRAASQEAIDRLARVLKEHGAVLRIEGHTDNIPIHNARFDSNWELSTARAADLVKLFITRYQFDPARLSAAGYAEFHPVAPNDTPENRARNRRVDIVVLNTQLPGAAEATPPPATLPAATAAGVPARPR